MYASPEISVGSFWMIDNQDAMLEQHEFKKEQKRLRKVLWHGWSSVPNANRALIDCMKIRVLGRRLGILLVDCGSTADT